MTIVSWPASLVCRRAVQELRGPSSELVEAKGLTLVDIAEGGTTELDNENPQSPDCILDSVHVLDIAGIPLDAHDHYSIQSHEHHSK